MIVCDRDDHHLISAVLFSECFDARADGRRRTDEPAATLAECLDFLRVFLDEPERGLDGRYRNQPALKKQRERHAAAGGETLSLLVRLGAERPDRGDDARPPSWHSSPSCPSCAEFGAIALRDLDAGGVDEIRKRVGQ